MEQQDIDDSYARTVVVTGEGLQRPDMTSQRLANYFKQIFDKTPENCDLHDGTGYAVFNDPAVASAIIAQGSDPKIKFTFSAPDASNSCTDPDFSDVSSTGSDIGGSGDADFGPSNSAMGKLLVLGLPEDTTDNDPGLRKLLSDYGVVKFCSIKRNPKGVSALIGLDSEAAADRAREGLKGTSFRGSRLLPQPKQGDGGKKHQPRPPRPNHPKGPPGGSRGARKQPNRFNPSQDQLLFIQKCLGRELWEIGTRLKLKLSVAHKNGSLKLDVKPHNPATEATAAGELRVLLANFIEKTISDLPRVSAAGVKLIHDRITNAIEKDQLKAMARIDSHPQYGAIMHVFGSSLVDVNKISEQALAWSRSIQSKALQLTPVEQQAVARNATLQADLKRLGAALDSGTLAASDPSSLTVAERAIRSALSEGSLECYVPLNAYQATFLGRASGQQLLQELHSTSTGRQVQLKLATTSGADVSADELPARILLSGAPAAVADVDKHVRQKLASDIAAEKVDPSGPCFQQLLKIATRRPELVTAWLAQQGRSAVEIAVTGSDAALHRKTDKQNKQNKQLGGKKPSGQGKSLFCVARASSAAKAAAATCISAKIFSRDVTLSRGSHNFASLERQHECVILCKKSNRDGVQDLLTALSFLQAHVDAAASALCSDQLQSIAIPLKGEHSSFLKNKRQALLDEMRERHQLTLTFRTEGPQNHRLVVSGKGGGVRAVQQAVQRLTADITTETIKILLPGNCSAGFREAMRERVQSEIDRANNDPELLCRINKKQPQAGGVGGVSGAPLSIDVRIIGQPDAVKECSANLRKITGEEITVTPNQAQYTAMKRALIIERGIGDFQQQWRAHVQLQDATQSVKVRAISQEDCQAAQDALFAICENRVLASKRVQVPSSLIAAQLRTEPYASRLRNACAQHRVQCDPDKIKPDVPLLLRGPAAGLPNAEAALRQLVAEIEATYQTRQTIITAGEAELLSRNKWDEALRIERQCGVSLRVAEGTVRSQLQLGRGRVLEAREGNILKLDVEAIVNPANEELQHAGGLASQIAKKAGREFFDECRQLVATKGKLQVGRACATSAGGLKFKNVIHTVGPRAESATPQQQRALISSCVINVLTCASSLGIASIAIPLISTGIFGVAVEVSIGAVLEACMQYMNSTPASSVQRICIVEQDPDKALQLECAVRDKQTNTPARSNATNSSTSSGPAITWSPQAQWYWQDDDRSFVAYDPDQNRQIEQAWLQFPPRDTSPVLTGDRNLVKNNKNYEVSFTKMKQRNTATNYERAVQRRPLPGAPPNATRESLAQAYDQEMKRIQDSLIKRRVDAPLNAQGFSTTCIIQGPAANVEKALTALSELVKKYRVSETLPFPVPVPIVAAVKHDASLLSVEIKHEGNRCTLTGLEGQVAKVKARLQEELVMDNVRLSGELQPKEWAPEQPNQFLYPVKPNSADWQMVETYMRATLPQVTIKSIERVQNLTLWRNYSAKKRQLRDQRQKEPQEMFLFHGTRTADPSLLYIGEDGFDMRYSTSGMWGPGVYFAKNASYSHSYANVTGGDRRFFLARVCVGDAHVCPSDTSLRMPPLRPNQPPHSRERFDSVCGNTGGSDVWILYENYRAYPEFLITYT